MQTKEKSAPLAYLRVRHLETREIVHSVGLTRLGERHVEKAIMGMLRNMSDKYFIDDSEVDKAREKTAKATPHS